MCQYNKTPGGNRGQSYPLESFDDGRNGNISTPSSQLRCVQCDSLFSMRSDPRGTELCHECVQGFVGMNSTLLWRWR